MLMRTLLLASILALSACQNQALVELDYQPEQNYQAFQSWQWAEPDIEFRPAAEQLHSDLDADRIRDAVSQQLLQQGLTQAKDAPLLVRAWLISEQKQQQTQVMHNDYWGGFWGPSMHVERFDTSYNLQTLQIDLLDSLNQKLVWRGSDSWVLPASRTNPAERDATLRKHTQRILQNFPPK